INWPRTTSTRCRSGSWPEQSYLSSSALNGRAKSRLRLLTAAAVPAAAEEPVVPATAATGIALAAAATPAAAHADSLRRGVGHHDAVCLLAGLRGRDTLLHGACAGLLHTLQGADVDRHLARLRHRFANGARPLTLLRFIMANVDRHFTRLRHQLANSAHALALLRLVVADVDRHFTCLRH